MHVEDMHMAQNLSELVKIHDTLLSLKPSQATHDETLCVLCNGNADGAETTTEQSPERGDMSQYTEEDLQAAVANATKPLQDELAAVKASQEQAAIEGRIAEITEKFEADVAELQGQLDTAVAAAEAATKQYEELTSFLSEEQEKIEAQAALDARTEEVRAAVASRFSAEYVDENIGRWAALAAEEFDSLVSDWDAAAKAATTQSDEVVTEETDLLSSSAMVAAADDGGTAQPSISGARINLMRNRNSLRTIGTHN